MKRSVASVLIVLAVFLVGGVAYGLIKQDPSYDAFAAMLQQALAAGDWWHLVAVALAGIALLPRLATGVRLRGDFGTRVSGFWHSPWGVRILIFAPPALDALAQVLWTQAPPHLAPVLTAFVASLLAHKTPLPAQPAPGVASVAQSITRVDPPGSSTLHRVGSSGHRAGVVGWASRLALGCVAVCALTAASCPQGQKVGLDVAACAVGQVPGQVAALLPHVEAALAGTPADWSAEYASLVTGGVDVAICAIKASIYDLTANGASVELREAVGHPIAPADYQKMLDRAQVALAQLGAPASR